MPWIAMLLTAAFYAVWGWQLLRLLQDIPLLAQMRRLYVHLLEVEDDQIRATEFSDIVDRVVRLHATHPIIADRLDAHTIANRIVRRENYLVALFNKDIFNVEPCSFFYNLRESALSDPPCFVPKKPGFCPRSAGRWRWPADSNTPCRLRVADRV